MCAMADDASAGPLGIADRAVAKELEGVKGLMFDCYKTLIDIKTDEDSLETYRDLSHWLVYQGVRVTPDELLGEYKMSCRLRIDEVWEKFPEVRVEELFSEICKRHAIWEIDEVRLGVETARAFRAASLRKFQAYPQSVRLLGKLKDYPMAVVSNGQRVFSWLELRYLGLDKYFQFILFSSDFGHKKPDPRIFLEAAKRLGLEPEEIMYIGDSFDNDIVPSVKLGMKALHVEEAWKLFGVLPSQHTI
jgi:putative hydrolase of the HAD superfamily